jgi:hypothetical protein
MSVAVVNELGIAGIAPVRPEQLANIAEAIANEIGSAGIAPVSPVQPKNMNVAFTNEPGSAGTPVSPVQFLNIEIASVNCLHRLKKPAGIEPVIRLQFLKHSNSEVAPQAITGGRLPFIFVQLKNETVTADIMSNRIRVRTSNLEVFVAAKLNTVENPRMVIVYSPAFV